ncbi:MAG: FtsH protease activity modulator HflK [Stomatobaculum sp.]
MKNLLKRLLEEAAAASKAKTRYQGMDTGNIEPEKKQRRKRSLRPLLPVVAALLVFSVAGSCWYRLDEDNYAVVSTLGSPEAVTQAGLHFKLPLVQRVTKVSKVIMGMPIGYIPETSSTISEEAIMITKDFNFVNTDFYLEYMVSDPVKYLYASQSPESMLKMLAQSYIRDTVGIYNVDDVITTGKAAIQSEIKEKLTNRMIAEDIGLSVVNITIQDAFPPTEEVLSAFKNVENAKQGKETAVNNANKDRNEKIPQAEAECDQIMKNAEAEKQARINEAEGQTARFEQMYAEYEKYPLITRQRMFYETMEDILPELKVYVTDGAAQTMLPLDSFAAPGGGSAEAAGSAVSGAAAGTARQ